MFMKSPINNLFRLISRDNLCRKNMPNTFIELLPACILLVSIHGFMGSELYPQSETTGTVRLIKPLYTLSFLQDPISVAMNPSGPSVFISMGAKGCSTVLLDMSGAS